MGILSGLIAKRDALVAQINEYKKEKTNCESLVTIMNSISSTGDSTSNYLKECSDKMQDILIDSVPFDKDGKILETANIISSYSDDINNALPDVKNRISELESEISSMEKEVSSLSNWIHALSLGKES